MKKSTILHLRIPFSIFLLPIFLLALGVSPNLNSFSAILIFIILHLFLYPASNSFNSYFDKDEQSIGLLENPPPVSKELYNVSAILDLVAITLGLLINWKFSVMLIIYSLVSRAYSHPSVRLKKYPIIGWFVAGFFQGFFTFIMIWYGVNDATLKDVGSIHVLLPALLCSILLWGSYPMTQVYQHEEDGKRGDLTLSRFLGIKGTFIFTGIIFSIADTCFLLFFIKYYRWEYAVIFQIFLLPVLVYFLVWFLKVLVNKQNANYHYTMKLNWISAGAMNLCFLIIFLMEHVI